MGDKTCRLFFCVIEVRRVKKRLCETDCLMVSSWHSLSHPRQLHARSTSPYPHSTFRARRAFFIRHPHPRARDGGGDPADSIGATAAALSSAHELDHITTATKQPVGFYDSNGAGLAINDLDDDGLLDIVLANLAGDNAILGNRGDLQFERQALPSETPARAAAIIDVDGDARLDIVFTQQAAAPLYWRNQAGGQFEMQLLRGVSYIGYAMNWLDADRDGDLDLLTGSYDTENEKILGQSAPKSGVIYYENLGDRFRAARLGD